MAVIGGDDPVQHRIGGGGETGQHHRELLAHVSGQRGDPERARLALALDAQLRQVRAGLRRDRPAEGRPRLHDLRAIDGPHRLRVLTALGLGAAQSTAPQAIAGPPAR